MTSRALRELISEALEAEGYRVLVADDGARPGVTATRQCRCDRPRPDDADSRWLGIRQKDRELSGGGVGLVCVSAANGRVDCRTVRALGVRSRLAKPFELDELVGVLLR